MLFSTHWVLLLLAGIAYASPIYDPIGGLLDGEENASGSTGRQSMSTSAYGASAHSTAASSASSASMSAGSLHSSSALTKSSKDEGQTAATSALVPVTTAVTVDRGGTTHTYTDYHTSYRSHSLEAPTLTHTFSSVSYTATPTSDAGSIAKASQTRAEAQQWKAIGVGVLSLAVVAAIVLGVYYWDKYRVVIRQVCCSCGGKRNDDWEEHLEPEGNKAWEARIAGEDGHRYPTMGSLEEIEKAREKAGYGEAAGEQGQQPAGGLPVPLHHGFEDAEHPLSPFFRRPSLRGQAPSTPQAVMMHPNTTLL